MKPLDQAWQVMSSALHRVATEKREVARWSGSETLWATRLGARTLFLFMSLTQNSFR